MTKKPKGRKGRWVWFSYDDVYVRRDHILAIRQASPSGFRSEVLVGGQWVMVEIPVGVLAKFLGLPRSDEADR